MSMADDIEWEPDNAYELYCALKNNQWVTKTGEVLDINKMETSHIINCLNKCIRDKWETRYIPLFEDELKKRKGIK